MYVYVCIMKITEFPIQIGFNAVNAHYYILLYINKITNNEH